MSEISIENLTVNFRVYHDRTPSLKDYISNLLRGARTTKYSEFSALNDVSLVIKPSERVGVVGHNGAGKSTLLKSLCGIYEPTKGEIKVNGRIAPLLEIGAGFHPEFTGRENIYLNGAILGYSKSQLQDIEAEVIEFAGVEKFIDTPVKYYSTGMYMRLAFSLATAVHPQILILDEMFAGGDASFVAKARERMQEMINKADIMVVVSHSHELVLSLCNRVVWLDHGRIVADGDPEQIMQDYLVAAEARKK